MSNGNSVKAMAALVSTVVLTGTLSGETWGAPSETRRVGVGERVVLSLPRVDARVTTNCSASVVKVFRNEASGTLELEAVSPGECRTVVDGQVLNLVVSDASTERVVCDQAKEILRRTGLSVNCHDSLIYVSGIPLDIESAALADNVAARYPGIILDMLPLQREEVQFDVVFLERRRQKGYDIGLDLSAALPAVLSGGLEGLDADEGVGWSVLTPIADNLALEAVVARFEVMEKRSVRVLTGEPATLASGGRAYFKISGVGSSDLKEVPFGFRATLEANERSTGYEVAVDILVSEPVPGGTDATIEIAERSVLTTVGLEAGEVVVIATGDSNRIWWRDSGIPLLHRIPVIGNVFGRDASATQPVQSAILISVREPGEAPVWIERLEALQERLEER